jgi:hypothetical protein
VLNPVVNGCPKFRADGLNFCGILGSEEFLDEYHDEIVFVQVSGPSAPASAL